MSEKTKMDEMSRIERLDDDALASVAGGSKDWTTEVRNGIVGSVGPNGEWVPWVVFGGA